MNLPDISMHFHALANLFANVAFPEPYRIGYNCIPINRTSTTGTMLLFKMNKKYTNLKIFNTLLNRLETNEVTKSCMNFNISSMTINSTNH